MDHVVRNDQNFKLRSIVNRLKPIRETASKRVALLLLRSYALSYTKDETMRFVWMITAILIMILPEATGLVVASDPTSLAVTPSHPTIGNSEALLLILIGGLFVWIASLGRKAKRHTPNKVHHAPAFPRQRN